MRIGVFDSGIGGITVLKKIVKKYPNVEYLYYADTLNLPYGEKTKEELISIGKNIIEFFESEKVDLIVIACGTCSSLIDEYRKTTSLPIYDVIEPTVEYIKDKYKTIGLLATSSTIENGIFQKKLEDNGLIVEPIACPDFVPYIEKITDIEPDMTKLDQIKKSEAIILGCTHYPLIKDKIKEYINLPIIEMGSCLTSLISPENDVSGHITVYVSKTTPSLEARIEELLGIDVDIINLDSIKKVK